MSDTITILQSNPTLRAPEVHAAEAKAREFALRDRIGYHAKLENKEDIVQRYLDERKLPITMRSPFYLDFEREACAAAGVPLVIIPDSVIVQLLAVGQDSSSHLIDTINSSAPTNVFVSQLEELNIKVESERKKLSDALNRLQRLQAEYVQGVVNQAVGNFEMPHIILDSKQLTTEDLSILNTINNTFTNMLALPSKSEEEFKTQSHALVLEIEKLSKGIAALNNDRLDLQSKILVENNKTSHQYVRELSGEEIVSNFWFSEF